MAEKKKKLRGEAARAARISKAVGKDTTASKQIQQAIIDIQPKNILETNTLLRTGSTDSLTRDKLTGPRVKQTVSGEKTPDGDLKINGTPEEIAAFFRNEANKVGYINRLNRNAENQKVSEYTTKTKSKAKSAARTEAIKQAKSEIRKNSDKFSVGDFVNLKNSDSEFTNKEIDELVKGKILGDFDKMTFQNTAKKFTKLDQTRIENKELLDTYAAVADKYAPGFAQSYQQVNEWKQLSDDERAKRSREALQGGKLPEIGTFGKNLYVSPYQIEPSYATVIGEDALSFINENATDNEKAIIYSLLKSATDPYTKADTEAWEKAKETNLPLMNTTPREEAKKHLNVLINRLFPQLYQRSDQYDFKSKYAQEHPYLAGLENVFGSTLIAPDTVLNDIKEYKLNGAISQYDTWSMMSRDLNTLRSEGKEEIRSRHGDTAAEVYDMGLEVVKIVTDIAISKGIGSVAGAAGASTKTVKLAQRAAGYTNMGSRAASSTMISVADRGGNSSQMLAAGTASALVEILTEALPFEQFMNPNVTKSIFGMLRAGAASFSTNTLEEAVAEGGNMLIDALIMQGQSENEIKRRKYVLKGMSAEEASKKVLQESIVQIGSAGLKGGILGGVMGTATTAAANISHRSHMNSAGEAMLKNPDALNRMLQIGIENNNTEAVRVATQIYTDGADINNVQTGKMIESVISDVLTKKGDIADIVNVISILEGRSPEYIGSRESIDTARAVMHFVNESTTEADRQILQRSTGAITLLTAIKGDTKAWDSVKAAAKADAEYRASKGFEQAAREVVEERNRQSTPLYARLEALSRNNEPITAEEAKEVTGFGVNGSELVTKITNTEGATFYETVAEVKPSYLTGFNNPDMDIKTVAHAFISDAQADAYTAGQKDAIMQNTVAKENAISGRNSDNTITNQIDEDMHIDNRTWEDVGDRKVKAFQVLVPEMKDYYRPLAQELLSDLDNTVEGERIAIGENGASSSDMSFVGIKRFTSEAIASIKDSTDASYEDIRDALNRLINDEGQENIALAKRIELVFDEMLTDGYTSFDGTKIPPNEEYIAKKEKILGKTYESRTEEEWDDDFLHELVEFGNTNNHRAVPVTESAERDSYLQNEADNDIINAKIRGENNGNTGEYDFGRETVLRENEEDRLHGRTNKEKYSRSKSNTSRRERENKSADSEKHGSGENPWGKEGKVRNVFHGTPYKFKRFLKSYVDMGIHFGSKVQAKERLSSDEGYITEFDLELKNPLMTEDIFGERSPEQYVEALIKKSQLNAEERQTLKKRFEEYCDSNISMEAKKSLDEKLSKGNYQLMMEISDVGIYIGIVMFDDNSNVNTVPMLNMINKNQLLDIIGFESTAKLIKEKVLSERTKEVLAPHIREQAIPFEEQYLKLRKIEDILQSFGYDGFAYQNKNEGDGWSYAVFDDTQIVRKSTNSAETDTFQNGDTDELAMWTTKRVGDKVKPKSISEIVATIQHEYGINITTGHIRGKGVLGQYTKNNRGIRTKIANNLPVISHELGHYFERTLDIKSQLTDELEKELLSNLDGRTLENYNKEQLVREGVAEYVRRFLQNRETAAIDFPLFTDFFLKQFSGNDLARLEQLADDINAYYSLDADTATSTIRLREEGDIDLRTPIERLKDKASSLYQAWFSSNHAIKRFDEATGGNAYKIASNAAYSDAIAAQILTGDLTDANGQYVSTGLKTALHGIDLNNKEEYRLFGEYLTVKHGPERLQEGMRIFADDRKNSTAWMQNRQAQLEEQYPRFKEVSERLYKYIRNFYQTWGVNTGLISEEALKNWSERWEYYVPFNRVMEKGKGSRGAKRGFANQNSTIKKARGSGRDIYNPVDNLIYNIVRMVNAGVRNNVMLYITNAAEKLGADATFLEKVPMPTSAIKMDMTGVKDTLTSWLEESKLDTKSKEEASGIVNNLDDVLFQYGRGKANGNVVTVLKNGNPQAWKINDALLLQSLTSLSPNTRYGILDAYAVLSRFMTSNITGNNIVWSIFSNLPRDAMAFFTYSKNKNVYKMAKGVGSAYVNKIKGDKADPLYKEYLAMGGGQVNVYNADRDLTKKARKKLSDKNIDLNPLSLLDFVSNTVEAGPRFATYKMMREVGMSPQEAFYEAMDVTLNFRRGGRIAREINKAVPFFNASLQGIDKFARWITAEEHKGTGRKKAATYRTISFVAVSVAIAAMFYALNNGDEEKEKDYEQLSTYTKNSYWVIPLGDGKYFAIPKPREIGVLSSFFERCMERHNGENKHAFDEFFAYASENLLPAIANDIAQIGSKGAVETGMNIIGSLGMIGAISYLGANRDFMGRPIVSSGLQNLEPKDQYTDRTSKIAYWLGQAFNGSPEQIDYFFQQILGGWWKYQKALFPLGEKNVDYTLGVGNTYIKDNQFSTDLTNWLYDRKDKTTKSKNSNPDDISKAITAKWDSNMVDFYGTYYKKAKDDSKSTAARCTRQLVLDMIREYQKGIDENYKTSWQEAVEKVCKDTDSTEYLPSVMSGEVTDGKDKKHALSDVQYVEYQTDYLRLYWEIVEETMSTNMSTAEKTNVLTSAKKAAREKATERTLKRIDASVPEEIAKYSSIAKESLTMFYAGKSEANKDNSIKKSEVVNVISGLNISDDDAWTLYLNDYDSKGANYAHDNGIEGLSYIEFLEALNRIDEPTESGKYGTYTQEEATRAVRQIEGLTRQEKAILWQSVNTKWKNNPFR